MQMKTGTNIYYPRFYENDGKGNLHRNAQKAIRVAVNASVITGLRLRQGWPFRLVYWWPQCAGHLWRMQPKSYV
jgi:hypothetical protein